MSEAYWVLYLFAAFLIVTGIKMFFTNDQEPDLANNAAIRWISTRLRVTKELHGDRFFVSTPDQRTGRMVLAATPLFLALVVINLADLVFAVDSVPAIFAITTDTFVVYTSNIMAVLGLRALYFALSAMIDRFHYLKHALAAVLVLGVVCTGFAYILYFRLIERTGPARALAVTFAIPAFAVFYGALLLGESITPWMVICALVIIAGTTLSTGLLSLGRRSA